MICISSVQVDRPVVMTSSVASLLQSCPRLSPHFTFTAPPSQEALKGEEGRATVLSTPLAQFVDIDPFEMSSKSVELAPPKSLPSTGLCCGGNTSTKEEECCGENSSCEPPLPAEKGDSSGGCCGGNGSCEPPQSKRQCCEQGK